MFRRAVKRQLEETKFAFGTMAPATVLGTAVGFVLDHFFGLPDNTIVILLTIAIIAWMIYREKNRVSRRLREYKLRAEKD